MPTWCNSLACCLPHERPKPPRLSPLPLQEAFCSAAVWIAAARHIVNLVRGSSTVSWDIVFPLSDPLVILKVTCMTQSRKKTCYWSTPHDPDKGAKSPIQVQVHHGSCRWAKSHWLWIDPLRELYAAELHFLCPLCILFLVRSQDSSGPARLRSYDFALSDKIGSRLSWMKESGS